MCWCNRFCFKAYCISVPLMMPLWTATDICTWKKKCQNNLNCDLVGLWKWSWPILKTSRSIHLEKKYQNFVAYPVTWTGSNQEPPVYSTINFRLEIWILRPHHFLCSFSFITFTCVFHIVHVYPSFSNSKIRTRNYIKYGTSDVNQTSAENMIRPRVKQCRHFP
jgi:hypothetical protein